MNVRRAATPASRFIVRARPMGLREGLSLESVPKLLEQLEGPLHR
jgi:hypothetical protein